MALTSANRCSSMRTMLIIDDDVVRMLPSNLIEWDNRGTKGVRLVQKVLREPVSDYYRWPVAMSEVPQTALILTHFYRNHKILLALWNYLAELNPKQRWSFENKWLLVKLWGKYLFGPWGSSIWLPGNMVRRTKISFHQKAYIHVIIYVGFYVNT